MKTLLAALVCLATLTASAQVHVTVVAPSIVFPAPPPLVVIAPGIQVVPDYDEEVFFASGWYWHRSGAHWFRSRGHAGGWVLCEPRFVPPGLARIPPGHYRKWHGPPHGHGTVVVNPPGPGRVKFKVKGPKHH